MAMKPGLKAAFFRILLVTLLGFCQEMPLFCDIQHYTVKSGDTFYSICKLYKIDLADLLAANGMKSQDKLKAGKILTIPAQKNASSPKPPVSTKPASPTPVSATPGSPVNITYTVKTGDSLWSLAHERGISVADILGINRMKAGSSLRVGQRIALPAAQGGDSGTASAKKPAGSKSPDAARSPGGNLSWPIDGERDRMQGKVQGVEIAGNKGDIVRAVSTGVVVWSGPYRGYGEVAFVKRHDGLVYGYGGNEVLLVKTGDRIQPGVKLGELGIDARRGKALAYLMIFKGSKAVDPFRAPRD